MSATPAVVLVLVTGIPAAGKTAFLTAVKAHAGGGGADARAMPILAGGCVGYVAGVLHMDTVLASLAAAHAAEDSFSPSRWKEATGQLLAQTAAALRGCLRDADGAGAVDTAGRRRVPLLFVEDNMHYRSMRERYYRMCRAVEAEMAATQPPSSLTSPFVALLEARFATPLTVCLERNAARGRAGNRSGAAAWVPPPVITSMDALFDHGYTTAAAADEAAGGTAGLWQWTASSLPWGLLVLHTAPSPHRCPTPAETAAEFLDVALQQPAANAAWQRQHADAARVRGACQRRVEADGEAEERRRRAAEAATTRIHLLDLQLRAVTHAFLSQQPREATADATLLRKRMSCAKQDAMARVKAELRQASHRGSDDGGAEEAQEAAVQAFQQTLLDLWEKHGAGDDSADRSARR